MGLDWIRFDIVYRRICCEFIFRTEIQLHPSYNHFDYKLNIGYLCLLQTETSRHRSAEEHLQRFSEISQQSTRCSVLYLLDIGRISRQLHILLPLLVQHAPKPIKTKLSISITFFLLFSGTLKTCPWPQTRKT